MNSDYSETLLKFNRFIGHVSLNSAKPTSSNAEDLLKNQLHVEEAAMVNKEQLCEKIVEIYPDIGKCGIDVDVKYDDQQQRWVVGLEKNHHMIKTFLESGDAELCLSGKQCVNLGIEINQLRDTVERYPS